MNIEIISNKLHGLLPPALVVLYLLLADFTLAKTEIIYPKNVGALVAMIFTLDRYSAPRKIEKTKILGALLELPAKQHCQSSPFTSYFGIKVL